MDQFKSIRQIKKEAKESFIIFGRNAVSVILTYAIISFLASAAIESAFEGIFDLVFRSFLGGITETTVAGFSNLTLIAFGFEEITALFAKIFIGTLDVGLTLFFLKSVCNQRAGLGDLFTVFSNNIYKKALLISLVYNGLLWLVNVPVNFYMDEVLRRGFTYPLAPTSIIPVLISYLVGFVLSACVKVFIYQSFFVIHDFPDLSVSEILAKNLQCMNGSKFRFFLMELSFIPLYILGILSFGIGLLWIVPFIMTVRTKFFLNAMSVSQSNES